MNNILTVKQVASQLRVCNETIYRWLRTGKVKGHKLGRIWRISLKDLENFMQGAESAHGRHTKEIK